MQKRADCQGRKKLTAAFCRPDAKCSVVLDGITAQECVGDVPELPTNVTRQYNGPFKDSVVGIIASEAFAERKIQKTMQCDDLHDVRFLAG